MRYDVFTLRGTAEPYDDPTNMLVDITRRLNPDLFNEPVDVDYPASIGPANPQNNPRGVPLLVSVLDGKVNLAAHIRDTSNPNVIVIGYSLGAMVVSAFLEDMAAGAHYLQGLQVSRVVLMSNPRRAPETPGGTYGIAGVHDDYPDGLPVVEVWNPADGITACPDGSPLRLVADGIANMSLAVGGGWRTIAGASMPWWRRITPDGRLWWNAIALARGYVFDGQHTVRYITQGFTARAADELNRWAG